MNPFPESCCWKGLAWEASKEEVHWWCFLKLTSGDIIVPRTSKTYSYHIPPKMTMNPVVESKIRHFPVQGPKPPISGGRQSKLNHKFHEILGIIPIIPDKCRAVIGFHPSKSINQPIGFLSAMLKLMIPWTLWYCVIPCSGSFWGSSVTKIHHIRLSLWRLTADAVWVNSYSRRCCRLEKPFLHFHSPICSPRPQRQQRQFKKNPTGNYKKRAN